jgi:hypothetical protein
MLLWKGRKPSPPPPALRYGQEERPSFNPMRLMLAEARAVVDVSIVLFARWNSISTEFMGRALEARMGYIKVARAQRMPTA